MPFFSLSRKLSHPNLSQAASGDVTSNPVSGSSNELPQRRKDTESTSSLPRPWRRKGTSTATRASSSPPMERSLPVIPKVESPTSDDSIREMPTPMPLSAGPEVFFTNLTMVPPREMIPAINPVPDLLAATWDQVKGGAKGDSVDRAIDIVGASETLLAPQDSEFGHQVTAFQTYKATLRRSYQCSRRLQTPLGRVTSARP